MARRTQRQRTVRDTDGYRRLTNPYEPWRVLSDDHVAHLHERAVGFLASDGLRVLHPEARGLLAAAGCAVDDDMVRFDPELVAAAVSSAPSTFEVHAPDPRRSVAIGGRSLVLAPAGGPPFVSDLSAGRRAGSLEDFRRFLRLVQHFDVLGVTSPVIEPSDVPVDIRHLHSALATLTLSDKVPFIYARGRRRMRDELELLKLRFGFGSDEELAAQPCVYTNINVNSPRQLDVPMSMAIIDFARLGQPVIMTPFTLAGAMAPVTLAGALVLQHLEALAAITLAQVARPGAPVIYGAFTSSVDLRSGSPAFGTPEAFRSALASGQLARHCGLPWRSSGSSTSNAVDAQAGYETMMNTFGAIAAGANWVHHAAGWQEGGLVASYEKFLVDVEMCQMLAESLRPVAVDDDEVALDAVREVGPGGHFFGAAHTLARYETAFYEPVVFTRDNFEQWTADGSHHTDQRAAARWRRVLDEHVDPVVDAGVLAAMEDFVARRCAEGGAPPD